MTLRWKVVLFVFSVSTAFACTGYLVQRLITLPRFAEVEQTEALDDLVRCQEAIRHDAENISNNANDYGSWDDTYAFIEDGNEEFKTENLIPETFQNLKLDLIAFIRKDGTLVWGEVRRNHGAELVEAPEVLAGFARADHRLVAHESPDSKVAGVMMTPMGPMVIGSAAVSTSDRQSPVRGAVVMGRFITDDMVQEIAARTRVALSLYPMKNVSSEDQPALEHLADGAKPWLDAADPATLLGYALITDIFDQPAMLLRADLPRTISIRGRSAAVLAAATSVGAGVVMVLVMWVVLSRMIVGPLLRVTSHAVRVGSQDDLRARLNMKSEDEIGVLAREFDRMVDRLAESRAQLLTVAHGAGMSQVAGNVLHNVGNVLSGVCVSADAIKNQLHKSEAGTLKVVSKMLAEHESDLGDFLTRNERGRQIPAFITAMAEQLGAEQQAMLSEVQSLTQAIEHIRHVVTLQQQHTAHKALIEMLEPDTIVEQAVTLCAESFTRHNIKIHRDFQELGALPLDKHRILQVVVNLLTNAIQAVKETKHGKGQVTLRVSRRASDAGDELIIRVEDDGVGVPPENVERIFAFGFTTRPGGQGIGLHSAANMAKEMGGSLAAVPKDPGTGAAFVLTIPMVRQEARA